MFDFAKNKFLIAGFFPATVRNAIHFIGLFISKSLNFPFLEMENSEINVKYFDGVARAFCVRFNGFVYKLLILIGVSNSIESFFKKNRG